MPANLSPEYKAAEAALRATRDPRTRLECVREMLRTIPKHKGTEHLQADIKARIKDLGEQLEGVGHKAGGHGHGPAIAVSAETGLGLGQIAPWLFDRLGVVRVYTKVPGHRAEKSRPFTLRHGQTVADVARLVHRDLVRTLRHARLWGASGFDGQQVGPEHRVADGDVVELHS